MLQLHVLKTQLEEAAKVHTAVHKLEQDLAVARSQHEAAIAAQQKQAELLDRVQSSRKSSKLECCHSL